MDLDSYLKKVALNTGKHKLILSINSNKKRPFFFPPPPLRESVEIELYDLENDPHEAVSIAQHHKGMVDSLRGFILQYYQKAGKRMEAPAAHSLDSETSEQLKALGYVY
jgi:hypothetical protein